MLAGVAYCDGGLSQKVRFDDFDTSAYVGIGMVRWDS